MHDKKKKISLIVDTVHSIHIDFTDDRINNNYDHVPVIIHFLRVIFYDVT